jgi:uncharacterized membrane-anchored protein YitT (DUF2179 family)
MAASHMKTVRAVAWNLLLLSVGALLVAFGVKTVVVAQEFIAGGITGLGLLAYYTIGGLSPGLWYLALNIPLFVLGWVQLSRRFFFYSLFGMAVMTAAIDWIPGRLPIHDLLLSALTAGTLIGAGAGIYLHSLGSVGGSDIIAIILNQKFNVRIGQFFFFFNLGLFMVSLYFLSLQRVLYSLILTFVTAQVTDYFLSAFNQRKLAIIISDRADVIADLILRRLNRGSTFLFGRGAYTGRRKKVILTVVNNFQLKRLEAIVFGADADAFVITESTFNVIGTGFSRRKVY